MNRTACDLLRKLLARAEKRSSAVLVISEHHARQYFAVTDPSERDVIHAVPANAASAGAVELEWGRFEAAQDLKRVRLLDADRLAALLVRRAGAGAGIT